MRIDRIRRIAVFTIGFTLLATAVGAQEPEAGPVGEDQAAMMAAWQKAMSPGEPHEALARGTGTWKLTISAWMDPNGEAMVSEGTAERQMTLGGRVLEEHTSSSMMGMPFEGMGQSGYDNVTDRYWSTWIDNMSTGMYLQHGTHDAEADAITYHGEFANPMTGEMTKVRSVLRWDGPDTQQFEWYEDHGSGELKTMVITYERAGE